MPQFLEGRTTSDGPIAGNSVREPRVHNNPLTGSGSPAIQVEGVSRRFADSPALSEIDLTVREGEFFSLLGPSGCGKTTLLRILAGLDVPDAGVIRIGGKDVADVPAHRRQVNTVFQSYALFPHMTVADNVAFGLRMKKIAPADVAQRVGKALDLVQIGSFADRKPAQLSGGQKQRVALARALVNEPQVLLLDEPLGALDLKLRKELQVELLDLQRRLGITFLYVTHDQEEALVMSDRIAVMRAGRIEQMGQSRRLYERPRTRFVAQFLGSCNLLAATIGERRGPDAAFATSVGPLRVELGPDFHEAATRSSFSLAIRPEKIALFPPGSDGENRIPVRVAQLIYRGSETHYVLHAGKETLTANVLNAGLGAPEYTVGQEATAWLPPSALVTLED
jgi:spermidine/putrescine transport system ATP-binding protein